MIVVEIDSYSLKKILGIILDFKNNLVIYFEQDSVSQAAWNLNEYDYKEVFAIDKTWNNEFDAVYFKGILKQM